MISLRTRIVAGFTLTELVVVLLVLGILAVFAVAKLSNMSVLQQRTDYDKVVSAIEYARKSAVALRRYVCVAVSATAVSLTIDPDPPEATATPFGGTCPFGNALTLPSPDASCPANQTCAKRTSFSATSATFQFDPRGRAA